MATKKGRNALSLLGGSEDAGVTKLRTELEQQRRQHLHEIRVTQEQEQHKAVIQIKDLKARLQAEKQKDLELQKEALNRRHETDSQKMSRQKDAEIQRLQSELMRSQDQLQDITKRGLSGAAREAFEAERGRLLAEVQELRSSKRRAEDACQTALSQEKKKTDQIRRLQETTKTETARQRREHDVQVRKLLEELKMKDRSVFQLERELGARTGSVSRLLAERDTPVENTWSADVIEADTSLSFVTSHTTSDDSAEVGQPPPIPARRDEDIERERRLQVKVTELQSKLRKLEDQCSTLTHDKQDLQHRVKDVERGQKPLQDRCRKFLEKNMELTSINRGLQDKIKLQNDQVEKLKSTLDRGRRDKERLSEQLSTERIERVEHERLKDELQENKQAVDEQIKTVHALKLACAEKDRRIELLAHRRRKQRIAKSQQKVVRFLLPAKLHTYSAAAGLRDTSYGYDEDVYSVDSGEMSQSSPPSSSLMSTDTEMDDDVFEEFAREEFERNYQRLVREHLELEKSFALLQSRSGDSHVDPQREAKDTSWMDEKEKMNKTLRILQKKVKENDNTRGELHIRIEELQEQCEVMEFRTLELEEYNEKLMEDQQHSLTYTGASLAENGMLQCCVKEKGLTNVEVQDLEAKLDSMRFSKLISLNSEEQVTIVQTRLLLHAAQKKLEVQQDEVKALKRRINTLEGEKADLLSAATGVSPDVVLEYEQTHNALLQAELKVKQLECEVSNLQQQREIQTFTDQHNAQTEVNCRNEISQLKRQLSSTHEGRDYESQLFLEKVDLLKAAEKKLHDLTEKSAGLEARIGELSDENGELKRHLTQVQDTQALTESDKDPNTLIHSLQAQLRQQQQSSQSYTDRIRHLTTEQTVLRTRLAEYETMEASLAEKNVSQSQDLDTLRMRHQTLQDELEVAREEAERYRTEITRLRYIPELSEDEASSENEAPLRQQLREARIKISDAEAARDSAEDRSRDLRKQLEALRSAHTEVKDLSSLRNQVRQLEETRVDLTNKLTQLRDLAEQETNKALDLQKQVASLDTANKELKNEVNELHGANEELRNDVSIKTTLLEESGDEQTVRFERQEERLARMSDNEIRLTETIEELEDVEKELRLQVKLQEAELEKREAQLVQKTDQVSPASADLVSAQAKVDKLYGAQRNLQDQVEAMEMNEQLLRQHLTEMEEKVKQYEQQPETSQSNAEVESKMEQLENENKELVTYRERLEEAQMANEKLLEYEKRVFELDEMAMKADALEEKIQELEEEKVGFVSRIEELERGNEKIEEYVTMIADLEAELTDFGECKQKLDESESEKDGMAKQLKDIQTDHMSVSMEKEALEAELIAMKREKENTDALIDAKLIEMSKNKDKLEGENNELKTKLSDVEHQSSKNVSMEKRVEELTTRESELVEQVHQLQLENQELQEHVDELVERNDGEDQVDEDHELREQVTKLENEAAELKDQLLRSKLDQMQAVDDDELGNITINVKDLLQQIGQLQERETALQVENKDLRRNLKDLEKDGVMHDLLEKLKLLEESESRLMEQIDSLYENESKLKERISSMSTDRSASASPRDVLDGGNTLRTLQQRIDELEKKNKQLEEDSKSMDGRSEAGSEVNDLQNKVDILLDTEERLLDRLQEQESVELELRRKVERQTGALQQLEKQVEQQQQSEVKLQEQLRGYQQQVEQLQKHCEQAREDAQNVEQLQKDKATIELELNSSREMKMDNEITLADNRWCHERIEELEVSEKSLKEQVNELQKGEAVMSARLEGMGVMVDQLKVTEVSLRDNLQVYRDAENNLKATITDLEKQHVALNTKVTDLEKQNHELMEALTRSKSGGHETHYHLAESTDTVNGLDAEVKQINHQALLAPRSRSRSPQVNQWSPRLTTPSSDLHKVMMETSLLVDTLPVYTPLEPADVDNLGHDEMVSRLLELQNMEKFHRTKIHELSQNLTTFRQAVEVVAITMETDADVPTINFKPKSKDSQFEARVQKLVKAEVTQKLRVLELEKAQVVLRSQLKEAELALKEQETEFREELERLEKESKKLRKTEAKLRNKLQYGVPGQESQALAKIQHLEGVVIDLEASERKLQRRLAELQHDRTLLASSTVTTSQPLSAVSDQDSYQQILQQLKLLEVSEHDLNNKLVDLDKGDSDFLRSRIAELERGERGLRLKLEMLGDVERDNSSSRMLCDLDTPEGVLRQRICEMEKMETHLKRQVIEMEADREELHDIARRDKSTIHTLTVDLRESQLAQRHLREQTAHLEATECTLISKVDTLTDRVEDADTQNRRLHASERALKVKLQKQQYQESDLTFALSNTKDDLLDNKAKHQKKVAELEAEKRELGVKLDELTDSIGELQGEESSLKKKLRQAEGEQEELKERLQDAEKDITSSRGRVNQLEGFNEALSQKVHQLEEEKSSLMFELSDLETGRDEQAEGALRAKAALTVSQKSLEEQKQKRGSLQDRLKELTEQQVDLQSRLEDVERAEHDWRRLASERSVEIKELEGKMSTADSQMAGMEDEVKEAALLQSRLAFQQTRLQQSEDDNMQLRKTLHTYERARAAGTLVMVPREELVHLREQEQAVRTAQKGQANVEATSKDMKETIDRLAQGKDDCGHGPEIAELKRKVAAQQPAVKEREGLVFALVSTKKAHELLKENYEDVKAELAKVKDQVKGNKRRSGSPGRVTEEGVSGVREGGVERESRGCQVQLAQVFTLRQLSPEFKNALRTLGTRYPDAYSVFLKELEPSERNVSHLKIKGDPEVTPEVRAEAAIMESCYLPRDRTRPPSGRQRTAGTATSQSGQHKPPRSSLTPAEKHQRIAALVAQLPQNNKTTDEADIWKTIESKTPTPNQAASDTYWTASGECDDVTLTIHLDPEDSSQSEASASLNMRVPHSARSVGSNASSKPPPLPASMPPTGKHSNHDDSFDLSRSQQGEDSDDEVPEIVDEDDGATKRYRTSLTPSRGKSTERDSDYSDGTVPPSSRSLKVRSRLLKGTAGSLESIPDSGVDGDTEAGSLRKRVHVLEGQLKEKTKQLELTHVKEKSTHTKDTSNGELPDHIKDKLSASDKEVKRLKVELQSLEDAMMGKTPSGGSGSSRVKEMKARFSNSSSTAQSSPSDKANTCNTNPVVLKALLDSKERDLAVKIQTVEELTSKLDHCHDTTREAVTVRQQAEQAKRTAEQQLEQAEARCRGFNNLQQAHDNLQKEHEQLTERWRLLQATEDEKNNLERIVIKLRGQLDQAERAELERQQLQEQVQALENKLQHKGVTESDLAKENVKLQQEVHALREDTTQYQKIEEDYVVVRQQFEGMEELKSKAQTMITPLRAKVLRLAKKCQTKDELIERMASALRQGNHSNAKDLLEEAEDMNACSTSEEYQRPISPLTTKNLQALQKDLSGSDSSLSSLTPKHSKIPLRMTPTSPTHKSESQSPPNSDLRSPDMQHPISNQEGQRNSGGFELSPPQLSYPVVTELNTSTNARSPSSGSGALVNTSYRAIKDYNPEDFSTSGHQSLELKLKEGDIVRVLGMADERGYHEAEVSGQKGLVPGLYLQPCLQPPTTRESRQNKQFDGTPQAAPGQIMQMYNELKQSVEKMAPEPSPRPSPGGHVTSIQHPAFRGVISTSGPRSSSPQGLRSPAHPAFTSSSSPRNAPTPQSTCGPPEPPSEFGVQRVVGRHSLLLGWQLPDLDELGRSNGSTVTGYKILLDGQSQQILHSPYLTKALMDQLDLRRPHTFTIHTVAQEAISRCVETLFQDVLPPGDGGSESDASSSIMSLSRKNSQKDKRMFMALYDYQPGQTSHTTPGQQLELLAGDIVVTYGPVKPDGFYQAKVRGRRGLVPASFMEEVALIRSSHHKPTTDGSSGASHLTYPGSSGRTTPSRSRPPSVLERSRPSSSTTSTPQGSRPGSRSSIPTPRIASANV